MTDIAIKVLVRLDANHLIGLAHAIRVRAILALLKTPHRVTVAGEGAQLANFFGTAQLESIDATQPDAFFALIGKTTPDLILIDHPRIDGRFWRALSVHAGSIPVVAVDDFGGEIDADIVINGTVLDSYHNYPILRASATRLVGASYALIRPEFAHARWSDRPAPSVLILIGSGDRARDWALQLHVPRSWGAVRMIVGQAFPDMASLKARCAMQDVTLESGVSGGAMAQAMANARIVLMTGGMVVYEALAVGVPAVMFPQISDLIPEARWFAQRGCIIDLGHDGGMDQAAVGAAVALLQQSPDRRAAMSRAQRSVIDGHGMGRAACEIDRLIVERCALASRP